MTTDTDWIAQDDDTAEAFGALEAETARIDQHITDLDEHWTQDADRLDASQTATLRQQILDTADALKELAEAMLREIGESGARIVDVDGVAYQVRQRFRDRWDREAVRAAVLAHAREHALDPIEALVECFRASDPRTTALPQWGIPEPGEFRDRESAGWQLVVSTRGGAR